MIHIYGGILVSKKYEMLSFVTTWTDLKGIILSVISQRKKILDNFIHMWYTKKLIIRQIGIEATGRGEGLRTKGRGPVI